MIQKLLYLALIATLLWSCEAKIDEFKASSGTANFETVVFIGNSLTSGYRDGALYESGQRESFPAIIAHQLALGGLNNKEFKQPYMKNEVGFGGRRVLGPSTSACDTIVSLGPIPMPFTTAEVQANMVNISDQGPFNNLGVPGARLPHLFANVYANMEYGNPYFGRFAPEATSTIISLAKALEPTFAFVWIGNNDVLGYATSGGVDTITTPAYFTYLMNVMAATIFTGDTKGAICNIPSVTATPFFKTIPNNVVLNETQVTDLNNFYTFIGLTHISFEVGKNFFVIEDAASPGGRRQITENELLILTLPQDSLKCGGWGTQKPIPSEYVLDATEIVAISV